MSKTRKQNILFYGETRHWIGIVNGKHPYYWDVMKQLNEILLVVCPLAFKQLLFPGATSHVSIWFLQNSRCEKCLFLRCVVLFLFPLSFSFRLALRGSRNTAECMHSHTNNTKNNNNSNAIECVLFICVIVWIYIKWNCVFVYQTVATTYIVVYALRSCRGVA